MRILLISVILISTTWADIVKKSVKVEDILQQIDSISQSIQQKQEQMAARQQEMMNKQNAQSGVSSVEDELMKKERQLQEKQQKLEYLKKAQQYQISVQDLNKNSISYIKKKAKKLISRLETKLDSLTKEQDYKVSVKQYMKIGSSSYAYLDAQELERVKALVSQNQQKVSRLKDSIEILKLSYNTDKDTLMAQVSRIDNSMQEGIESLKNMAQNMPTNSSTIAAKNAFIKVKIGDKLGDVLISAIDDDSVTIVPKEQ